MSTGDMPIGSAPMSDGIPDLFYSQVMYWVLVGSAIAAATLINVLNEC